MAHEITMFANAEAKVPEDHFDFDRYLNCILDGKWEDIVHEYRNIKDPETKKAFKKKIPAFTPSGKFDGRGVAGMVKHNGFICMDIDDKDNVNMSPKIERLKEDPHVYALHQSVGGFGYAVYFRIESDKHKEAFEALEEYLMNNYFLISDTSCKDKSRLRFVSYDPNLYKNENAQIFRKYKKKKEKYTSNTVIVHTESDMDFVIQQINERGIDLTDNYNDWYRIGFALASEYGERGRDYYHAISRMHEEYSVQSCDKKYDNFLKNATGKIGIGTFFQKCKEAGVQVQTEKTRKWEVVTTNMITKSNLKPEAILENIEKLAEADGDDPKHADEVAKQVLEIPIDQLKKTKDDNIIPLIKLRLAEYELKRNDVTHEIEYNGKPITDTDINSIWAELATDLGTKCTKNYIHDLIGSNFTKSYNPFLDFFEANKDREMTRGHIQRLINAIKIAPIYTVEDGKTIEVSEQFKHGLVSKWIISLIASMHGTYSLLILVLCGHQGIGKTNFFRWLLPAELRDYYGESKLDRGKDDEILMCRKLILCDDEFSGKSKNEYKLLKQYASTQFFNLRQPYGRKFEDFRRYAVLCGTSNENEVINDPTGNRRIIPMNVLDIDFTEYNNVDKTALLLEAYAIWKAQGDSSWQLNSRDINTLEQYTTANKQVDSMEEAVNMFFTIPTEGEVFAKGENVKFWSTTEVQVHIEANTKLKVYPNRLGMALQNLGYVQLNRREDGKSKKGYWIKLTGHTLFGNNSLY